MSDERLLSAAELAEMRQAHSPCDTMFGPDGAPTVGCDYCEVVWPCEPAELLDHIDALAEQIAAAEGRAVQQYCEWCRGMRIGPSFHLPTGPAADVCADCAVKFYQRCPSPARVTGEEGDRGNVPGGDARGIEATSALANEPRGKDTSEEPSRV